MLGANKVQVKFSKIMLKATRSACYRKIHFYLGLVLLFLNYNCLWEVWMCCLPGIEILLSSVRTSTLNKKITQASNYSGMSGVIIKVASNSSRRSTILAMTIPKLLLKFEVLCTSWTEFMFWHVRCYFLKTIHAPHSRWFLKKLIEIK